MIYIQSFFFFFFIILARGIKHSQGVMSKQAFTEIQKRWLQQGLPSSHCGLSEVIGFPEESVMKTKDREEYGGEWWLIQGND